MVNMIILLANKLNICQIFLKFLSLINTNICYNIGISFEGGETMKNKLLYIVLACGFVFAVSVTPAFSSEASAACGSYFGDKNQICGP
ncbi:hypothetical protein [Cytobacillus purgationiresistens]|uniref:Uncharacterized protein n=1 Tax=Cytobacillus purgationiresistens TaxID=863449 RepID=A0ABU0ACN7_9BACI|nr:hypothetical protein [Cytobacillus purgationiresistens]MDQ0269024.1 hypothetical protein [Cytobacillus purgationiresistens]